MGSKVDANRDSKVTSEEIAMWARTLGRPVPDTNPLPDEVSCVKQDEFVAGMKAEGFSDLFAESLKDFLLQYSPPPTTPPSTCTGLDTQTILDNAANGTITTFTTSEFGARFLKYLSDFCGNVGGVDLYSTNEDCKNLPNACVLPPFVCEAVCVIYTFGTTASNTTGAFSQRVHFQEDWARRVPPRDFPEKLEAMFQDTDGNGVFSTAEQTENLQKNFDLNKDSCVDEAEYNAQMSTSLCDGFDLTEDYVSAKFAELTGGE